ncbi:MAG: TolC family protein [Bacteroidaceae bacterium]|nr:TolC family protein [Bacteroidaceae bacterium]
MKKSIIICMVGAAVMMSSCRIYKSYERPDDLVTDGLYRDPLSASDTLNAVAGQTFGDVPWREVFTDYQLQSLIEQALENNADIRSAQLTIEQAQASLMSARLSYLPSFTFSPQGTYNHAMGTNVWTYSVPVAASWQVDLFGQLLNPNRKAKVSYEQAQYYEQAVQANIIAAVANLYYTLLMLDRQYQISEETAGLMKRTVETMEAMKDAGMTNSAAVEQSRTNYSQVVASLSGIKQTIRETENSLCLILNVPGQEIPRTTFDAQQLPTSFETGVPVQMLTNRPDVRAAEMSLAACYYDTNSARAAFFPQLTITGQESWTNNLGQVVNPGKFMTTLMAGLTQPLFAKGRLVANLKAAKANEEKAKLTFQTTLLKAGNEVSNALYKYQMNTEKSESRKVQVASAKKASEDTADLFELGTSSYLEVLSAQSSYLSAQLAEVTDTYDRMQAVINLYTALGGGKN